MPPTERAYPTIGGVPLRYQRIAPQLTRYYARSTSSFEKKLDQFSYDLDRLAPSSYGTLLYFATAGAYVNKPKYHGMGRAFDLDRVRWRNVSCIPLRDHHRSRSRRVRRRYIGVDAVARRWFKYVLDGWYNGAHHDHIHLDDGGGALVFNVSYRSDVVFVQAAANAMIGTELVIDGIYGPRTRRAFRTMKNRLDIPHRVSSDAAAYRRFLGRLARHALRDKRL